MSRGPRRRRQGQGSVAGSVGQDEPLGGAAPRPPVNHHEVVVPGGGSPRGTAGGPPMAELTATLPRYNERERMNHWLIALLFFMAGLSGLAFFHPSLFFFSHLFGGGAWTRILHPFFGLLMVLAFLFLFTRLWRDNVLTAADREWRRHAGDLLRGNKAAMPPVGKYNAGQKIVFWAMSGSLLVLLVTGFVFWRPWFAPYFPIGLIRAATLLHAVAALVLVLSVIVHVYAAIWVKGSVRAMTRGTVTAAWARQHHALWHEQMTRGK